MPSVDAHHRCAGRQKGRQDFAAAPLGSSRSADWVLLEFIHKGASTTLKEAWLRYRWAMIRCYWVIRVADTLSAARGSPQAQGRTNVHDTNPIPPKHHQFIHYPPHPPDQGKRSLFIVAYAPTTKIIVERHPRSLIQSYSRSLSSPSIVALIPFLQLLHRPQTTPIRYSATTRVRAIKPALYAGLNTNGKTIVGIEYCGLLLPPK